MRNHIPFIVLLLIIVISSCSNVVDLDDQLPKLIVTVDTTNMTGVPDQNHQFYLLYYNKSDWTEQWLQQGSVSKKLLNIAVLSLTTYLVLFWDKDGTGTLTTGDPVIGYNNVAGPTIELTKLGFFPLEIKQITMALSDANVYP